MPIKGELAPLLRKAKSEGWLDRVRSSNDENAVLQGCTFNQAKADDVVDFFPRFLRHSKGRDWGGKPFELADWQKTEIIEPLFGWVKPGGYRRFTVGYFEIPKKNGKSTMAAGVGTYMLVGDGEPGAEVYTAATKIKQASIVHDEAIKMVKASRSLMKNLRINHSTKVITFEATNSKYEALASDAQGSEGLHIHCLICDELHVWKGRTFWDALRYGMAARMQPLHFIITTAGVFDKTTIGWEQHQFAEDIIKGEGDVAEIIHHLAYIRAAKREDDWTDPNVHEAANPNYGVTIHAEEMRKAAAEVKHKPAELNSFLRYRLNIWTESAYQLIDMQAWDDCQGEVDLEGLKGRECYGGLDMSSVNDLTAFVLIFPPMHEGDKWVILPRAWVPRDGATKREHDDKVPYLTWARQGHITLTEGVQVDLDAVKAQIEQDRMDYNLVDIAYDAWGTAEAIRHAFEKRAGEADYFIKFGQTIQNYSAPTKELTQGLIPDRQIIHDGNPVMRWCAANLSPWEDGNENIRPSKKSSRERIDIIVAAIMAYARARLRAEKREPSMTFLY